MEALEIAKELGIQVEVKEHVVEYVSPVTGKRVQWEKNAANLLAVMRKYRAQRYQESMARGFQGNSTKGGSYENTRMETD